MRKSILVISAILAVFAAIGFVSCADEPYIMARVSEWDGETATTEWYTANKDADEFIIGSASDLAGLAELVNGGSTRGAESSVDFKDKTIKLDVDINLNNHEWTPIGNSSRVGALVSGIQFKGTFNGNNHKIYNLKISGDDYTENKAVGFIGALSGGSVKNLKFENVDIDVPKNKLAAACVGLVVDGAVIDNVEVSGKISAKAGVGAIAGRVIKSGTINECVNNATVTGSGNVGGIAGAAYYSEKNKKIVISNCTNNGVISNENGGYTGGIVGLSCADVTDCTNTAPVIGNGESVGGIIGEQKACGTIKGCNNSAEITNSAYKYGIGGNDAGGIVGNLQKNDENNFVDALDIHVMNNTSTTVIDNISVEGKCKDVFAYNNKPSDDSPFVVKDNHSKL